MQTIKPNVAKPKAEMGSGDIPPRLSKTRASSEKPIAVTGGGDLPPRLTR